MQGGALGASSDGTLAAIDWAAWSLDPAWGRLHVLASEIARCNDAARLRALLALARWELAGHGERGIAVAVLLAAVSLALAGAAPDRLDASEILRAIAERDEVIRAGARLQ